MESFIEANGEKIIHLDCELGLIASNHREQQTHDDDDDDDDDGQQLFGCH
jgi:hypothetical protein